MNLHQLRVFFHVANCLSFSRASEELHISQPAVSVQVRKLEEEIGLVLIEQIGKKLFLTEPGIKLQDYANRIFTTEREAENMLNDFRGLNAGKLVIAVSSTLGTYYIPNLLAGFKLEFPNLEVIMNMGNAEWVEEQIIKNSVDLAITEGELSHTADLTIMPFLNDELVIIADLSHRLASKEVSINDLIGEPFILREAGSNTRKVFRSNMTKLGIPVHAIMELESTEAIKRLVSSGVALGVVSKLTLEWEIACGRLTILNIRNLNMTRTFSIVHHKDKKTNKANQEFIDFLCKYSSSHQNFMKDCECTRRNK